MCQVKGRKKAKKLQKVNKGKGILKFGLSEEDISEVDFSEADSVHSSTLKGGGGKGKKMIQKKKKNGATDQQSGVDK